MPPARGYGGGVAGAEQTPPDGTDDAPADAPADVPAARTCDFCGAHEADGARAALTWTTATERGRERTFCPRCSREHLRAMESKLDSEWW